MLAGKFDTDITADEVPAAAGGAAASSGEVAELNKQLVGLRDIVKFLRGEKDEIAIQHERLQQVHSRSEHQLAELKHQASRGQGAAPRGDPSEVVVSLGLFLYRCSLEHRG